MTLYSHPQLRSVCLLGMCACCTGGLPGKSPQPHASAGVTMKTTNSLIAETEALSIELDRILKRIAKLEQDKQQKAMQNAWLQGAGK